MQLEEGRTGPGCSGHVPFTHDVTLFLLCRGWYLEISLFDSVALVFIQETMLDLGKIILCLHWKRDGWSLNGTSWLVASGCILSLRKVMFSTLCMQQMVLHLNSKLLSKSHLSSMIEIFIYWQNSALPSWLLWTSRSKIEKLVRCFGTLEAFKRLSPEGKISCYFSMLETCSFLYLSNYAWLLDCNWLGRVWSDHVGIRFNFTNMFNYIYESTSLHLWKHFYLTHR